MNHRFITRALGLCLPLVAAATFATRDAHALGPIDVEVAAKVGGGSTPSNFNTNPLGFGIGARGGIQAFGLYGGLNIVDYLGASSSADSVAGSVTSKFHALQYGIEAGYGFKLAMLQIRGQLGLGNLDLNSSVSISGVANGDASNSKSYFYLEPGVLGELAFGILLVGVDVNYLILPSGPGGNSSSGSVDGALTVHGQVGVSF